MASITLKVGAVENTYDFKKIDGTLRTNTEMSQIIEWFITELPPENPMPEGLTVAQQNQWKLDAAMKKLVRYMRREALKVKNQQGQSAVQQQAALDTEI